MSIETDVISDQEMQCPPSYYGGYKRPGVEDFGTSERSASDPVTGESQFSTMTLRLIDADLAIRQEHANPNVFWTEPWTVRMVSRQTRAALGTAYTVHTGPVLDAQASDDQLHFDVTLGDLVSAVLLPAEARVPWRTIGDGGLLAQMTTIADGLDRSWPEPIIYGKHYRIVDVDVPSPEGFVYAPIYLGIQSLSGVDHHCWLAGAHACAGFPELLVKTTLDDGTAQYDSVIADEGTVWKVPHHAGFLAEFGAPYVDYVSPTYGDIWRYSPIYGKVGEPAPDACAAGTTQLVCKVDGVEPVGDGSGDALIDGFDQYLHFMQNYCANNGADSYRSGAYLTTPTWTTLTGNIPMLAEPDWAVCQLIAQARLPEVEDSGYPAGYIRAFVIGAQGDRPTLRDTVAQFNIGLDCRDYRTHDGSFGIFMLSPSSAIKASAPVFTDVVDILKGKFGTQTRWGAHENTVPFRADFHTGTGGWRTTGSAIWDDSVTNWGTKLGQVREYKFVPGITHSYHLARLAAIRGATPPRVAVLEGVVGPMAKLEPGDYIHYQHYAAVADTPTSPRLAQVISVAISPTPRTVRILALDCEDLIDYDAYVAGSPSPSP